MKPDATKAAFDAAMLDKAQRKVSRLINGDATPSAPGDDGVATPADSVPPDAPGIIE